MSSEKTEEPTPRRLRRAREEGDVPVSAALTQAVAFVAALATLPAAAEFCTHHLLAVLRLGLAGELPTAQELWPLLLVMTVPLLLVAAMGAVAAGAAQAGGLFTLQKLVPKLEHLDPIAGFKRLFQLQRIFQLARAFIAAVVVTWLVTDLLSRRAQDLVATTGRSASSAAGLSFSLIRELLWLAAAVSIALACLDVLITRRGWIKRNRMSKDEVTREHKQAEGDPQIKQQRRRAHEEALSGATLFSVKDANIVIVNPTHLASALRYDDEQEQAPRVVAQGEGLLARQIVEAARAYGVPVVRDVPVARALRELEVGEEIPEVLYEAVAEILREVWSRSEGSARDE